ncbi:MAG: hypothetical protein BJ554DRAFT_4314 [Olpidium bornovanus]|uniref:Uncharacterized protein n=1 Tax=Olpidium bornovanus TaxID=278681 RepID=A0A8H8DEU9_9FUNG|nr:MAG: hypothetical protein BJ554DRAFT_4314 [Olpidium bornovanus]
MSKSGGRRNQTGNGYTADGPDEVLSISSENSETDGDSPVKPTKSTKPNRTLRSFSRTPSLTPPPVDPREYEIIRYVVRSYRETSRQKLSA